jgi:hypothetical protein
VGDWVLPRPEIQNRSECVQYDQTHYLSLNIVLIFEIFNVFLPLRRDIPGDGTLFLAGVRCFPSDNSLFK